MGDVKIRAIYFLAILFASLAIAVTPAGAEPVPSILVGLTKSLLNDIDPEDFKGLDGKIAERVNKMLRQARMRSWASAPTKIAVDRATLAAPLGLDPKKAEHLKALDAILAAENKQQRQKAFARALKITGSEAPARAEIEQVEKQFNKVLRDKIGNRKTSATIEVDGDDGGLVKVSWDPDTSSFITRLSFEDGTGNITDFGAQQSRVRRSSSFPIELFGSKLSLASRSGVDAGWVPRPGCPILRANPNLINMSLRYRSSGECRLIQILKLLV